MDTNIAEFWQPLPTCIRYDISNTGKVWDNNRFKLLNQKNANGYKHVFLNFNGQHKSFAVHRLVLWAFCGVLTTKTRQCNHKDGNKSNNNLSNLEYVTPSENIIHAYKTGLHPGAWTHYKVKYKQELINSKLKR